MVIRHHVKGYDEFCEYMKQFSKDVIVHVYFSGSKLPNGESWCPDCVRAQPIVESLLEKCDPDSHFVLVEVGDRPYWKSPTCPFRQDPRLKLLQLPTLLRWTQPQRLDGEQCEKPELVEMLFTDED